MGCAHRPWRYLPLNHPACTQAELKSGFLKFTTSFIHQTFIEYLLFTNFCGENSYFIKDFLKRDICKQSHWNWNGKTMIQEINDSTNKEENVFRHRADVTWNYALSFLVTRAKREIYWITSFPIWEIGVLCGEKNWLNQFYLGEKKYATVFQEKLTVPWYYIRTGRHHTRHCLGTWSSIMNKALPLQIYSRCSPDLHVAVSCICPQ